MGNFIIILNSFLDFSNVRAYFYCLFEISAVIYLFILTFIRLRSSIKDRNSAGVLLKFFSAASCCALVGAKLRTENKYLTKIFLWSFCNEQEKVSGKVLYWSFHCIPKRKMLFGLFVGAKKYFDLLKCVCVTC